MNGVPIIRIDIEGARESIQHALMLHNDEFNQMISEAVDKSFTVETIKAKIEMQVAKALDNAIDNLSEDYRVKAIVTDIVLKSLIKKRDEIEKEKQ